MAVAESVAKAPSIRAASAAPTEPRRKWRRGRGIGRSVRCIDAGGACARPGKAASLGTAWFLARATAEVAGGYGCRAATLPVQCRPGEGWRSHAIRIHGRGRPGRGVTVRSGTASAGDRFRSRRAGRDDFVGVQCAGCAPGASSSPRSNSPPKSRPPVRKPVQARSSRTSPPRRSNSPRRFVPLSRPRYPSLRRQHPPLQPPFDRLLTRRLLPHPRQRVARAYSRRLVWRARLPPRLRQRRRRRVRRP